jgi:hypothetical protein
MPRKSEGKTATIKERRIDIYAPTLEVKDRWDGHAGRRKQSRSQMVFELVELALAAETGRLEAAPGEEALRVEDLHAQLALLRRRNQDLESLKERLERELEEQRALTALGEAPLPNLGPRLISVFSEARGADGKHRAVDAGEIRQALQVGPGDGLRLRELQQAIATLEVQGMIRTQPRGWVWIGS